MATKTYSIPNISCQHCVMSISKRLNEIEGVDYVEGNANAKSVTVDFIEPATDAIIRAALQEINYPAEG